MAMRQMGCTGFSFLWFLLMKKFARKIPEIDGTASKS